MSNQPGELQPTTRHHWPDPESGPWTASLVWETVDGRPECVGVSIEGAGATVLTGSVLRKLPLAEWIAADRARMTDWPAAVSGLRRSTVERLTEAAEVYQRARREKRPPTKAVADHYQLSHGGAANLVSRARAAGLLPPTSPGVPTA